jgi:hypothetical protein
MHSFCEKTYVLKDYWKIYYLRNTCSDYSSDLNGLSLFNEGINNQHKKCWLTYPETDFFSISKIMTFKTY